MTKGYERTGSGTAVCPSISYRAAGGGDLGLLSGVSESVVSSIVCGYLDKYAGSRCSNLRQAIQENVDLYQLWVDNASREGVMDLKQARYWTRKFPKVQRMVTAGNVKRWLRERHREDIVRTIEGTEGGERWLEWQIDRFRTGLWGPNPRRPV